VKVTQLFNPGQAAQSVSEVKLAFNIANNLDLKSRSLLGKAAREPSEAESREVRSLALPGG
jgi:hypothetical protein